MKLNHCLINQSIEILNLNNKLIYCVSFVSFLKYCILFQVLLYN